MSFSSLTAALSMLIFMSSPSMATTAKETNPQVVSTPLTTTALLETVVGLILILGLILALAWLIKRTGRFQTSANGDIKMLAGLSLGPRERAVLLEVKGEHILVGVTPQQINTLHILDNRGQSSQKDTDKYGQFDQQLQKIMDKD